MYGSREVSFGVIASLNNSHGLDDENIILAKNYCVDGSAGEVGQQPMIGAHGYLTQAKVDRHREKQLNKRLIDHQSEYALGTRTPAADSIAQTVPSTHYYENLTKMTNIPADSFGTLTCFGKTTLETLKISSPYPNLHDQFKKY